MTNQHDSFPDMMHEDLGFEVVMRGYSRRQVHDHMGRMRNQIRDLEERLARSIDQSEQGRIELAEARRRLAEAPQDYDELGQRLSAILKLGEEEALAKRQSADTDAAKVREEATAEVERMLAAAQAEAERRVHEATAAAERLLAQAGADAEEALGAARSESEETLRDARAEADRALTTAQHEAERLVSEASAEAESTLGAARAEAEATLKAARADAGDMLASAQRRAASLDEHTGRRVTYLTDTHGEVMRRLGEMGSVLSDLLQREKGAGPLVDEAAVLPPAPPIGTVDDVPAGGPAADELDSVRVVLDDSPRDAVVGEPGERREADAPSGPDGVFDDPDVPGRQADAFHPGELRRGADEAALHLDEPSPGDAVRPAAVAPFGDAPQPGFGPGFGAAPQDAGPAPEAEARAAADAPGEGEPDSRGLFDARVPHGEQPSGAESGDTGHVSGEDEPVKGRIRGFFEHSDVHLSKVPGRPDDDETPTHRP
ncbi:hypothetical protein [Sphaerisporangium sp. TRM90804]|uniref:hypothetical protein n=1 Tax=Sphaerisporangium sp. TRM90804 TaxID=3031113 RepID=UPI00244A5974|nr:hypothetical protein [Sphaerisporangium sp. TRM90804]MDH2429228.1 hypothetical protein [Sphaerisporangium sp. TRM90804]